MVRALPALDTAIVADINVVRARHGLSRLHVSRPLTAAAAFHTDDMAQHGFFAHESYDGTSFSQRLSQFYRPARGRRVGETLIWYDGSVGAARTVHDWLSSAPHRAILLAPEFREVGVAAVRATAASGVFNGPAMLVTADFGSHAPS